MAGEMNDIIEKMKNEAVERCRRRILQAAEKRGGQVRRPENRAVEYGMTSALKQRHGL